VGSCQREKGIYVVASKRAKQFPVVPSMKRKKAPMTARLSPENRGWCTLWKSRGDEPAREKQQRWTSGKGEWLREKKKRRSLRRGWGSKRGFKKVPHVVWEGGGEGRPTKIG